ncbi:PREDICTED: uncharacterized protein LOC109479492 [Branchiostoma belcheri]|uniref:Uncharacterized protein LOC109479492 n=1 Tax=Branchiostoma belcheri TaxID=7741 RepID=A0A6P5A1C0_BRABE|nr:PREDICTED: uncharacterized protein LOC109479492 [Branchiostoma belcheri]
MSGRPTSSRGGRGSGRGNRGRGRGRGPRGGGQGWRTPGGTSAGAEGEATTSPHFTTDQLVAVVKALSTSLLSQEGEDQYENDDEEEDTGNRGKRSYQEKISAREGRAIRELVSILFDKPGEISIVKLQQKAREISQRQEYQDPGKLASFLQKHDLFETRLNKDGVMLVKVKRDVTLCGKYTASTCKEDGCTHFHLCRHYATGQGCSNGLSCRYSHNLKDDHNIVVLQDNFLDGLAEAQVLSMITGKSTEASKDKTTPPKPRRPPSPNQRRSRPVSPVSEPASQPRHPPRMPEPLVGSHSGNYRPKRPSSPHHRPPDVTEPSQKRQEELERLPRCCYFYNCAGKSCRYGPKCTAGLHVCTFYLTGSCSRKPCQLSHNLFDPQPRDLLKKSGLLGKPGKYIVGLYKEKFEARRKEKQESHRWPYDSSSWSYETDEMPTIFRWPSADDVTTVPEHWEPMGRAEDDFVLVEVSPVLRGDEINGVKARFHQTLPSKDTKIHSVKRVQNYYLWDLYCKKENQMKKQNNDEYPKELRLFHGTNQDAVSAICRQNFDWRLSGCNVGRLHGRGSYFTKHASFASAYAQPSQSGHRFMFLAKVLVGRYTKGDRSYRRPPPLNESDPYGKSYDSCVDRRKNS